MRLVGPTVFILIVILLGAGSLYCNNQDKIVEQENLREYGINEGTLLKYENTQFRIVEINGEYMWISWYDEYGEHTRPAHISEILEHFTNENGESYTHEEEEKQEI